MVTIDIRARRKAKKEEHTNKITATYLELSGVAEQEHDEKEASAADEYT
jgi:hypothetical protein